MARRCPILLLVIAFLGGSAPLVRASDDAAFEAWWNRIRDIPRKGVALSGQRIVWRRESADVIDPAALDAVKRAVAENPMHPDRSKLPRMQEIAAGHTATEFTAWCIGARWRLNQSSVWNPKSFYDCAAGKDSTWSWLDERVRIAKPSEVASLPGQVRISVPPDAVPLPDEVEMGRTEMAVALAIMHAGVLFAPIIPRSMPLPNRTTDSRWDLDYTFGRPEHQFRIVAHGTFDPRAGNGRIEESRTWNLSSGDSEPFSVAICSQWRESWVPGLAVAGRVEYTDRSAEQHDTFALVEFGAVSEAELDAMLPAPTPTRADPIRGAVAAANFTDLREQREDVTSTRNMTQTAPPNTPAGSRPNRRILYVGAAVLGICAAAGMLVWARKATRRRAGVKL